MASVELYGTAPTNIIDVSGLIQVTDFSKVPSETTWRSHDGYLITAFGTDLSLDSTGKYGGTAKDLRVADSTGNVIALYRGVNVPLFPLTSGFSTATFLNGDDTLAPSQTASRSTIDGGLGSDTVDFTNLSGKEQVGGSPTLNTGVILDLKTGTAVLKFVSGHFQWANVYTLVNIENATGTQFDDQLNGDDNDNSLRGLAGNDVINAFGGNDTVDGGDGNDTIFGADGNDHLGGNGGNDELYGDDGDDTVVGGGGDDFVSGGDGCDVVNGDDGDDVVDGGADDDIVSGGNGNDSVGGNGGNDKVYGDAGNDTVVGGGGNDKVFGGDGHDVVNGDDGDDYVDGGAGDDQVYGGDGWDVLFGGYGNDCLYGGAGNDDLYGQAGNDFLSGGDGVDFLTGGLGRDVLYGGADTDYFNYDSLAEVGKGATRDLITDFMHGVDKIGLADIDANSKFAGNQAFKFGGYGITFNGTCGLLKYFYYNPAGTANDRTFVQGDINGDKVADFQIELSGLKYLTASDFLL